MQLFSVISSLSIILSLHGKSIQATNTNQFLASECDHVRRRVLAATDKLQTKTLVLSPLHVPQTELEQKHSSDGETARDGHRLCDVWTMKVENGSSYNLLLTVNSLHLQKTSALVIVADIPKKTVVLKSDDVTSASPTNSLPLTVYSLSRLTLIWTRRTNVHPKGAHSETIEHLSFSYCIEAKTNRPNMDNVTTPFDIADSAAYEGKDEKAVLTSAIIISVFTIVATVISIVRAGVCKRCKYFCQYQRVWKNGIFFKSNRRCLNDNARDEDIALNLYSAGASTIPAIPNNNIDISNSTNNINNNDNSVDNNISNRDVLSNTTTGYQRNERERIRDTRRVLLEIEVPGNPLREEGQALMQGGRDVELGNEAESCSLTNPRPTQETSSAYRERRVRFEVASAEDNTSDDNNQNLHLQLDSSNGTLMEQTPISCSPQMAAPTPESFTNVQANAECGPRSTGIASQAIVPCQYQTHSLSEVSPSPSSPLSARPPGTLSGSNEEHVRSPVGVLGAIQASATRCPTCSTCRPGLPTINNNFDLIVRGRQSIERLGECGGIILVTSPDPLSPPPYYNSSTPPPSYSSLFPD